MLKELKKRQNENRLDICRHVLETRLPAEIDILVLISQCSVPHYQAHTGQLPYLRGKVKVGDPRTLK